MSSDFSDAFPSLPFFARFVSPRRPAQNRTTARLSVSRFVTMNPAFSDNRETRQTALMAAGSIIASGQEPQRKSW
jgi:precorrin-6x reductase